MEESVQQGSSLDTLLNEDYKPVRYLQKWEFEIEMYNIDIIATKEFYLLYPDYKFLSWQETSYFIY